MSTDPFKKRSGGQQSRQPRVPQDPVISMQQHGLHGDRSEITPSPPVPPSRRVVTVPIEKIRPGRYQKRETINQEAYQQLKHQIQELGLNFVAILCSDPDDHNFYNLMMGGHLRLQAANELGIMEVSAIIREYDRTALAKGTYFENNGRQELTVIEEGLLFKQCQEDEGWTQEEIAEKLLVPGGRSHVALCLLTVTSAPDIQAMLRQDPKRGQRCFYYLRQLDILGIEKAIELRAPLIQDFLSGKISTDEVHILVEQILQREQQEEQPEEKTSPLPTLSEVKRQSKITLLVKNFRRYERDIGEGLPSQEEREALLQLKTKIEDVLKRT